MTTDTAGKDAANLAKANEMKPHSGPLAPLQPQIAKVDYAALEVKMAALLNEFSLDTMPIVVKLLLDNHEPSDVVVAITKGFESKLAELRQKKADTMSQLTQQVDNGSMSHGERTARVGNIERSIQKLIAASGGILS